MMTNLILWDYLIKPQVTNDQFICYWNDYEDNDSSRSFSICKFIEENDREIKKRFIYWVEGIGKTEINDVTLNSTFLLPDNFSYWWLSEFVELSNFQKSRNFNTVLKIIALSLWLEKNKVKSIEIQSKNLELLKAIDQIAKKSEIKVLQPTSLITSIKHKLESLIINFIYRIKSLFFFPLFMIKHRKLLDKKLTKDLKIKGEHTFVSYFNNFNYHSLFNENFFESHYWGGLSRYLKDRNIDTNWLHFSLENEDQKFAELGKNFQDIILGLNNDASNSQSHFFVESFFTKNVASLAVRAFTRIFFQSFLLQGKIKKDVLFFDLIKTEFVRSFQSHHTLKNILYFYLIREFLDFIKPQKKIVYLHENLPWEKSLAYLSKKSSRPILLGNLHTNVRFWDLRYAHQNKLNVANNHTLIPDYYCYNSNFQKESLLKEGYPEEQTLRVEALRFENLLRNSSNNSEPLQHDLPIILLLGCYVTENTQNLIDLAEKINSEFENEFRFLLKPHPASSMGSMYSKMNITISNIDIIELINKANIVLANSITTAALDAYLLNKSVFVYLKPGDLNLSPLREIDESVFFSYTKDLVEILKDRNNNQQLHKFDATTFYFFDEQYSNWMNVLGIENNYV